MANSSLSIKQFNVNYLEVYQNWMQNDRDRNKRESTIPITEIVRNVTLDTLLKNTEYETDTRQETDDYKLIKLFYDYMPERGEEGFKQVVNYLNKNKYIDYANDLIAQRQKFVFQSLSEDFAEKLDVVNILPYLKETIRFSDNDMTQIMNASQSEDHRILINIVQRKCPGAFEPFYMCLLESEQFQLAELIYSYLPNSNLPTVDSYKSRLSKHAIEENQKFYKEQIKFYGDVPQTCGVLENLFVETVDVAPSMKNFDTNEIYRNFSNPKGLALIINNRKFSSGDLPERIGTDVDAKNLNNLLDQLGYKVEIKENQTISGIRSAMMRFAKMKEHENCDSSVVVMLTHGIHGALYCSDNEPLQVDEFVGYLNSVNCPALVNKPKIFIIQACRGVKFEKGLKCRGDGKPSQQTFEENILHWEETDAKGPSQADILIAYSTTPGYVSWRNSEHGSWFVQGICKIFCPNAKKEEVLHLFTKVNKLVSEKLSSHGHVQIPELCSRLRKKFYFYPVVNFSVANLPLEVLEKIFFYLSPKDQAQFELVCWRFFTLVPKNIRKGFHWRFKVKHSEHFDLDWQPTSAFPHPSTEDNGYLSVSSSFDDDIKEKKCIDIDADWDFRNFGGGMKYIANRAGDMVKSILFKNLHMNQMTLAAYCFVFECPNLKEMKFEETPMSPFLFLHNEKLSRLVLKNVNLEIPPDFVDLIDRRARMRFTYLHLEGVNMHEDTLLTIFRKFGRNLYFLYIDTFIPYPVSAIMEKCFSFAPNIKQLTVYINPLALTALLKYLANLESLCLSLNDVNSNYVNGIPQEVLNNLRYLNLSYSRVDNKILECLRARSQKAPMLTVFAFSTKFQVNSEHDCIGNNWRVVVDRLPDYGLFYGLKADWR